MPKFLDLNQVVEEWGWRKYEESAKSRKQRQMLDKMRNRRRQRDPCIGVLIDWSLVEFQNHTDWPRLADDDFTDSNSNVAGADTQNGPVPRKATSAAMPADAEGAQESNVNVLFETKFTNDTGKEQVYTLRIDKTTRSTCSTELEHGITKGVEIGLALKMPTEVFEANAGFKREVTLVKTEGETMEEELNWGAESTITVEPDKIAKAKLMVREKKQSGDFEIISKIRGNVLVSFTNRQDNNSLLFSQSGDVDYIVETYLDNKKDYSDFVSVEDEVITVVTKGKCKFRYGVKQEVEVVQEPLQKRLSPSLTKK